VTGEIIQQNQQYEVILPAVPIAALLQRREMVLDAITRAFKKDVHFGIVPGTKSQSLLKPGAELLCHLFLLEPAFEDQWDMDGRHRTCVSTCTLTHIPSGRRIASARGMASTMESKHRWRYQKPKCPYCGAEAIRRSTKEGEEGFYCWRKENGCSAKFAPDDERITSQKAEKIENPDPADCYHTVLSMAQKRSLVAAVRIATAVSDLFTDEIEHEIGAAKDEIGKADQEAELLVGARIKESPWARAIAAWLGAKGLPAEPTVLQMHGLLDRLETLEYTPEQFGLLVGRCNRHIGVMLGNLDVEIRKAQKAVVGAVADLAEAVADVVSAAPPPNRPGEAAQGMPAQTPAAEKPKRGPGRPKGSGNKPKAAAPVATAPETEVNVARDLVGEPRPKCVGGPTLAKFALVVDSYPDGPNRLRALLDDRGADRVAALQPEAALAILNVLRDEAAAFESEMADAAHDPAASAALDEFGLGDDDAP